MKRIIMAAAAALLALGACDTPADPRLASGPLPRIEDARRLWREGLSVPEIAAATGASERLVQSWADRKLLDDTPEQRAERERRAEREEQREAEQKIEQEYNRAAGTTLSPMGQIAYRMADASAPVAVRSAACGYWDMGTWLFDVTSVQVRHEIPGLVDRFRAAANREIDEPSLTIPCDGMLRSLALEYLVDWRRLRSGLGSLY